MRLHLLTATLLASSFAGAATAQISAQQSPASKNTPQPKAQVLRTTNPGGSSALVVGGSDDCANAMANDSIAGQGSFAFDNTVATSGAPLGSCGAMGTDVWFYWTADVTGIATVTTCSTATSDTVIAIWDDNATPGLCPTTQLACVDDACGLQTTVSTSVTAGAKYFIEIGDFAGGTGGSGTFAISIAVPSGNDACAAPLALVGNGPHPFNTAAATTGSEGQAEGICFFFGSSAIFADLWFTWVAPSTGNFDLSLCGASSGDTKVAVYNGSTCPVSGTAIACNDDFCGLISDLCFAATSGQTYLIQVGNYSSAGGAGSFTFTPSSGSTSPCQAPDDGSSENAVGLTAGGAMCWGIAYGVIGQNVTISSVDTCIGTPLFPGGTPPAGTSVTIAVWEDPNDDGNPSDGVLQAGSVTTVPIAAGSIDTDVLQNIVLTNATSVSGIFFVGAVINHAAGQYPAPLDQSGGGGGGACGGGGAVSWAVGNTTGTFDYNNLAANDVPPLTIASAGLPGNWLLRINCGPSNTGTGFCFGDGTGTACPCLNSGAAGHGCENSFTTGGALLQASGAASVGADGVVLLATDMPPSTTCLFFQGTTQISIAFGDGLRCAGGSVVRLGTKAVSGGMASYPGGGDPSITTRCATYTPPQPISAGDTRSYQAWYRNIAAFCTPSGFNLSNGLSITWGI